MPTYRRADIIGETLATVARQSFRDFEMLIRSDGPDPQTREQVGQAGDSRFRYSEAPAKLGMPGILNSLIPEATGEYVLVLHDHDLFHQDLVGRMVDALDRLPTALFVHTALQQIDGAGKVTRQFVGRYKDLSDGRTWLDYMLSRFDCPVCAMSMVRRSAYESYGLYDPDYGFLSDVEMWMRLSLRGDVAYIDEVLMSCRTRGDTHEFRDVSWDLTDSLLRIHERYQIEAGRTGVWARMQSVVRAEFFRLVQLLAALKRSRGAKAARANAARYLRERGGVVSRVVARVL